MFAPRRQDRVGEVAIVLFCDVGGRILKYADRARGAVPFLVARLDTGSKQPIDALADERRYGRTAQFGEFFEAAFLRRGQLNLNPVHAIMIAQCHLEAIDRPAGVVVRWTPMNASFSYYAYYYYWPSAGRAESCLRA